MGGVSSRTLASVISDTIQRTVAELGSFTAYRNCLVQIFRWAIETFAAHHAEVDGPQSVSRHNRHSVRRCRGIAPTPLRTTERCCDAPRGSQRMRGALLCSEPARWLRPG